MFYIAWRGKFYSDGHWIAEEDQAQKFTTMQEAFAIAQRYVAAAVYSTEDAQ